jgi:proline dehydrogenase
MEDSRCVDREISLYRRLKAEFPGKCWAGIAGISQKNSGSDLENMMDMHLNGSPLNFRLCKGIYIEPKEIAWKGYDEVSEEFLGILEYMLKHRIYAGIATHDKYLIEGAYRLIEKYNTPGEDVEFQMLYGVTPELRSTVLAKGYRMRVYVPFGKQWFGYSTRRLKENPRMATLIIKALFRRG